MSDELNPLKAIIEADIARFKREFNDPPPIKYLYGDGSGEQKIVEVPADERPHFGKSVIEGLLPLQIELDRLGLLR